VPSEVVVRIEFCEGGSWKGGKEDTMEKLLLLALTLLAVASLILAQKKGPPLSKESLEVAGAKLRLGMAKADVAERIASFQVLKVGEDEWMIEKSGTVHFRNGKLCLIDRSWLNGQTDPIDAFYGAVSSLNREGYSSCTISADTRTSPDSSFNRVWLDCGQKSVLVIKGQIGGHPVVDVLERLGTVTADSE
jgi:hypothetical protein